MKAQRGQGRTLRWRGLVIALALLAVLLPIPTPSAQAQGPSGLAEADPVPVLVEVEAMLAERPHARDEAWRTLSQPRLPRIARDPGSPDQARVTFAWRGGPETTSVRLDSVINVAQARQPVTDYRADFTLPLTRIEGSDIWVLTLSVPRDVAAVYSFLVEDGAGLQRWSDPANPSRLGGVDGESLLRLDRAPSAGIHRPLAFDAVIEPQGLQIASAALNRSVRVSIYRSPEAADDAPLLILYDAFLWGQRAPASDLLARLAERGDIPPSHLVLIDQLDGASANQAYADQAVFVAEELLPALRREAGLAPRRETTLLAGASRRGLSATLTALARPDVIGGVISLSGSFYWAPEGEDAEWARRQLDRAPANPPRFHLAAGRLETVLTSTNRGHVMLDTNTAMAEALAAQGYPARLTVFPGGHDIAGWRSALADGLIALLGEPAPAD